MAGMVIVGGGLAGLAAAHALSRFGIEAEVFEAAPALGEIGAAVNVAPNATQALIAIGLGEKIAAVGARSPGIYTRNMQTGEFLEFNDRFKAAQRYGAPYYTFHRADLLDVLASELDRRLIHLDRRLVGVEEASDGVVLAFANGAKVEADFVIGADGVRSVIRQALYGQDNPTYTGQMVWRALLIGADVPPDVLEPTGHVQWVGPGLSSPGLLHPRQQAAQHRHPGGHRQMGRGGLVHSRQYRRDAPELSEPGAAARKNF